MSAEAEGKKKYATILPAASPIESGGAGSQSRTTGLPPRRQRRAGIGRFACDVCRSRKSACNGERPCAACVRRKTQCAYTAVVESSISPEEKAELELLRQENEGLRRHLEDSDADILKSLGTLPEDEALLLLYRLRATALGSNANVISTKDIPSPSRTSLEFELTIRHPMAYPAVSPESLLVLGVPDVASQSKQEHDPADSPVPLLSLPTLPLQSPEPTITPFEHRSPQDSGDLCDARLGQFQVHEWLQTPVSTEFAAHAISFYLTTEHPILGLFDADLFLDDLIAHKTDFCSPLLLSALLSFSCQGYTAIDPKAAGLSHVFFAEAEKLYSEEKNGDPQFEYATMMVAATQLMSASATWHGKEEVANKYLQSGIQLAYQNGLLAVGKGYSARNWLDDNISHLKAASHTAWGTFCRATLYGMNYQNSYIDIPPWLPIPGTTIVHTDGHAVPFNLPWYMGSSFIELCKLMRIVNSVLQEYHRDASTARVPFAFAESVYNELLQWADSLPITMARGQGMPHHVAVLHIQLHATILDLFRPFLHQTPRQLLVPNRVNAAHRTPEDVCLASVNQLKHLILTLRVQHKCATASISWHNALLYVANACLPTHKISSTDERDLGKGVSGIGTVEDPHRRTWFLACLDGYRALAPQFNIVKGIVQGLLSIAMQRGLITTTEGRALMDEINADTEQSSESYHQEPWQMEYSGDTGIDDTPGRSERPSRNTFVVDLNTAVVDLDAASVDALIRTFEGMAMLDEFTTETEQQQ